MIQLKTLLFVRKEVTCLRFPIKLLMGGMLMVGLWALGPLLIQFYSDALTVDHDGRMGDVLYYEAWTGITVEGARQLAALPGHGAVYILLNEVSFLEIKYRLCCRIHKISFES